MTPTLKPTPKQWEVIQAIRSRKFRYLLFGGAMSGGKSYLSAMIFLSMAKLYPGTRYGVFRRNMTALKRTTYQTFRKVSLEMGYFLVHRQLRADEETSGRDRNCLRVYVSTPLHRSAPTSGVGTRVQQQCTAASPLLSAVQRASPTVSAPQRRLARAMPSLWKQEAWSSIYSPALLLRESVAKCH
jgi:hypothetical protein